MTSINSHHQGERIYSFKNITQRAMNSLYIYDHVDGTLNNEKVHVDNPLFKYEHNPLPESPGFLLIHLLFQNLLVPS